ncbi:MAG: argininosuccinate lyase, partial [Planctomycetales bacterium]|nr:argininosuccinate lyase [Planctomycetales bacterium]
VDRLLAALQRAFVDRAEADFDCILPAYTHMRRAQPVLASHYWLAYCEKLQRDRERLADARKRVNVLPLGGAAAAGTTLPIDRESVRKKLGFDGIAANSIDVSSDRDFVLESAFALTTVALHLSGWAEEWILWSSTEFGFLRLPQSFCTGSSIMPQKVNPDVLELIRGKTARVVGSLQTLIVLVKGLPLAYNRDLQEDKQRVFDAADTVESCLALAAAMVAGAELNREAIEERLEKGYLDATTLMEFLIARGVPQRTAHEAIGQLVAMAMRESKPLAELPLERFQTLDPSIDESVYQILGARRAVQAFVSSGSTSPDDVARRTAWWKQTLGMEPSSS